MARRGRAAKAEQVYSVTSVQRALSEDVDDRATRYLVSMSIRTACVLLAAVLPSPWRWIAVAGAVLLPLVSVFVANAGRELPTQGSTDDPRALDLAGTPAATSTAGTAGTQDTRPRFDATVRTPRPYDPDELRGAR